MPTPDPTDPVVLLLGGLYLWWIGATAIAAIRSSKPPGRKALWVLAIVVLAPFGPLAYLLVGRDRNQRRAFGVTAYLTLAALAAAVLLALGRDLWPGHEHIAWIAAWSLVTFTVYALDKSAAKAGQGADGKSNRPRVNEVALHLLALFGGFVGGWFGRHLLRHKTKKPVFAVVLVVATVLHGSKLAGLW